MSDQPTPPPTVNPFSHPGPTPSPINPFTHPGPPPRAVNPFDHPGSPPPVPGVYPATHPGPPPPIPGVYPATHPGPPPTVPGVYPATHPGPPPKQAGASLGSIRLESDVAASVPIEVQLRRTREIICEKPVKNTSFSGKSTIVEIVPFSGTPKTITLVGNAPGDTHVTFLFTDGTADRVPVSVAG